MLLRKVIENWEREGNLMSEELRSQDEFFRKVLNLPKMQSTADTGSSEDHFGYIRGSNQAIDLNVFFTRYDH